MNLVCLAVQQTLDKIHSSTQLLLQFITVSSDRKLPVLNFQLATPPIHRMMQEATCVVVDGVENLQSEMSALSVEPVDQIIIRALKIEPLEIATRFRFRFCRISF